jgi:hypothetical protein
MSAVWHEPSVLSGATEQDAERLRHLGEWSPASFAREQIRGLVRQVFFASAARSVRQVVFSAAEPETDVRSICRGVGRALALETAGSVAVAGGHPRLLLGRKGHDEQMAGPEAPSGGRPLKEIATRLGGNLWLIPALGCGDGESPTAASLQSYLGQIRREFEYSIVQAPPAGESNDATVMGQFADGIILVLSAHHTRRVSARRIKESLAGAQARVLGTVLSDRVFPIPEAIYRRL